MAKKPWSYLGNSLGCLLLLIVLSTSLEFSINEENCQIKKFLDCKGNVYIKVIFKPIRSTKYLRLPLKVS